MFFKYRITLYTNVDDLTFFFPICMPFISLYALTSILFYFFKLYYACETVEEGRENLSATACV